MMPLNKDDLTNLVRSYLKSIEGMEFTIVPIERDELTSQLIRIAKALETGIGSGPDTIPIAITLMLRASTRLRKYEDLIVELERWIEANMKEMKDRVSELERWRDARESYEREQSEYK